MHISLPKLLFSFLVFYLVWDIGFDYVNDKTVFSAHSFYFKSVILKLTGFVSFFLYPCATCFILRRFVPRKIIWAFVFVILAIPFIVLFRYILQEMIVPAVWGFHNYPVVTAKFYFFDNLYFAVLFTGFGFIYFFTGYALFAAKQQAALAMSIKEAELSFLKSQVNPHFLFNSLNNIYTLIYQQDEKALTAVEELSSILRYALYEQKDTVLLEMELSYLMSFIRLQSLRFDSAAPILVDLDNVDGKLPITPHLLISFVENAFKHGDLSDPAMPLSITAQTDNNRLIYQVSNKKAKMNKSLEGGIGLNNVQRRLELVYKGQYALDIADGQDHFSITLTLAL